MGSCCVSACSMKNYKGMITVLQLLYGKWIWITPAILNARENSFEAIRLCALPVLQSSLRLCNSFYDLLMCVRLCLSAFMKNGWIWEFLPVFHILLNTSRCNQLNLSPSKINGHVHIMRTMERGWQVIMMCVRNNVITEAGSLTRQIGKGVTQLITLDHLLFKITLSSICTAVQNESWPHPLKYLSCWKATPTHFVNPKTFLSGFSFLFFPLTFLLVAYIRMITHLCLFCTSWLYITHLNNIVLNWNYLAYTCTKLPSNNTQQKVHSQVNTEVLESILLGYN